MQATNWPDCYSFEGYSLHAHMYAQLAVQLNSRRASAHQYSLRVQQGHLNRSVSKLLDHPLVQLLHSNNFTCSV